ncbi:carbohydrate kinase family protein [Gephyromycinifex aptenodytis]|uniref:carbohydrate kinase family protein n=1 Tax=Gephyromycinifex aptenodytis TaxID=2716227 RepID=UPI001444A0BA|nr:carbohydrate kinase [Gephyromycinifex aptenodytis]
MSERILVVGEALVDIVHRSNGQIETHPGGSPLNVAVGLARLGHPVHYATRFGHDPHGEIIREHLAREGNLRLTPGSDTASATSTAVATLDENGAASYDFDITWDIADALDSQPVGHLHVGSIGATLAPGAQAVLAAARAAHASGTVSYDPNARPSLMGDPVTTRAQVEELIAVCDVVKASDEDIAWLYDGQDIEPVMSRWADLGAALVVITRGKDDTHVLLGSDRSRESVPSAPANVIDTVGAGDSFMAGLLSGLLDLGFLGGPAQRQSLRTATLAQLQPALQRAVGCAAITVARAGANPPHRKELVEGIGR